MDLQLLGKRALVTGSTLGIGYAIAEALAREGTTVVVNGRTSSRVDETVERIRSVAPEAAVSGIAADLGTASGVDDLVAALPDVDILVNNLDIFEPKPFAEIADGDWLRFFEVNVMSGVRLGRHYFPRMLERGWGRVIFISSESVLQIPAEMIHYGMTKIAELADARHGRAHRRNRRHRQLGPRRPDGLRRGDRIRGAVRRVAWPRRRGDGEGVLRRGAADVAPRTLRAPRRGRIARRLRREPARLVRRRRIATRRRRPRSHDRVMSC